MKRRQFIHVAGAASACGLVPGARLFRNFSESARIEVLPGEPIGTIAPEIYGHFLEHLGGVMYDGIWVGEDSKIPNYKGIRKELVDHLKRVKPAVVRWPGGCFADSYDWRDGIGPRARRPRRVSFWEKDGNWRNLPGGPGKFEPNHFGTHEFMQLCQLIGAQPYLAVNVRSLPAKNFYEWIDYCNAPAGATTLADERAANGARDPFKVRFWGVGNESWDCGGSFTPEEYAQEYRRFISWVPRLGVPLAFIGAGPNGYGAGVSDIDWTRRFFTKLAEMGKLGAMWGWGLHYYARSQGRAHPTEFTTDEWYDMLRICDRMDSLIARHWAVMGELDRDHRVKLAIDEWGNWHNRSTDIAPTHIYAQQVTLRDALSSAINLDTFNRHADKVVMSCPAQAVNCLQSLFLAHENKFLATPNYDVFEMYAAHQGGQSLRTIFSAPQLSYTKDGKPVSFWTLAGSASLKDRQLTLTVVNAHASEAQETEINVRGAGIKAVKATVLTGDIHAHNTFEQPNRIRAKEEAVALKSAALIHRFAPASVTKLQIELA